MEFTLKTSGEGGLSLHDKISFDGTSNQNSDSVQLLADFRQV